MSNSGIKKASRHFNFRSKDKPSKGRATFILSDFAPATSFGQVNIREIKSEDKSIVINGTEIDKAHNMLFVDFTVSRPSVDFSWMDYGYGYAGDIDIYYSIIDCIALSSAGEEYGQAFISTTQGLQELDGFY